MKENINASCNSSLVSFESHFILKWNYSSPPFVRNPTFVHLNVLRAATLGCCFVTRIVVEGNNIVVDFNVLFIQTVTLVVYNNIKQKFNSPIFTYFSEDLWSKLENAIGSCQQ